jgi:hypothetical protein
MNIRRLAAFLLIIIVHCAVLPLSAQETSELVSPAHKIAIDQPSAEWKPLFDELSHRSTVSALFTENRYLPFKKIPVVFEGEMRYSRERGLGLHYLQPDNRILIVDTKGVLARDAKGRPHELSDARAQATVGPLLNVMSFDLPELAKTFDLYGVRAGATWRLAFEPRTSELANSLSRLVINGHEAVVTKIEMRKSSLLSVEILIHDAKENVPFTPDEIAKFFR